MILNGSTPLVPSDLVSERASSIACMLSRFSPEAIRRSLDYMHQARDLPQKEVVKLADTMRRRTFRSPDFSEGVKAFFEKRDPD